MTSSVVRLDPARRAPCPAPARRSSASPRRPSASAARCCAQSLRSLGADPAPLLAAAAIDPAARAEDVPVAGFVALANALDAASRLPQDDAGTRELS